MSEIFLLSLIAGAGAGLLAGLFGIGGGLVLVPILVFLFTAQNFPAEAVMIMAVATSLATIVVTSATSVIAHHRLGAVVWRKVLLLAPGVMIGGGLGAALADFIPADVLRYVFVLFLCCVGVQMAFDLKVGAGTLRSSAGLDFAVATAIGVVSALLGIGGGTVMVPYLVASRYPIRNAVAIASACGVPIAVVGTLSYAWLGGSQSGLPDGSLGYVYLPAFTGIVLCSVLTAPLGARLAQRLPAKRLKRYFSLLLLLVAVKLIWH